MDPKLLFLGLLGLLAILLVDAIPLAMPPARLITLPLNRIKQRTDLHPRIAHQLLINRSYRRYARMTGRAEPSFDELADNLRKRFLEIESAEGFQKRYNHFGSPKKASVQPNVLAASQDRHSYKAKHPGYGPLGGIDVNNGDNSTAPPDLTLGGPSSENNVTPAVKPEAENSLGLNVEANDVGYLATVQIGTPPRNFLILMDSGSADLWVGGENCTSLTGGNCGQHQFLGSQTSKTFKDGGRPFQVKYGTGQVAGSIVQDTIILAGFSLKKHVFGVTSSESIDFSDDSTPFDGLMGLAKSTLSEQQTPTPIEALATAGLVPAAITSYKISRVADNKNDGQITFGGLDTTKFDQKTLVELKNVNPRGFWEAAMDGVTVNGRDLGLKGRTAIIDTGTTLIIAPPQDAAAFHAVIPGAKAGDQGTFTIPCATEVRVALSFGGATFDIDTRDLVIQFGNATNADGSCISGVAGGKIGGVREWLVGDVFLKNVYFSTNVDQDTLSLAKHI